MSSVPISLLVAHAGRSPSTEWGSCGNTLGMIHAFAGDYAIEGLLPADGRPLDGTHPELLKLVASAGHLRNGEKFALPDLTGLSVIGATRDLLPGTIGHGGRTIALHWIIAIDGIFPGGGIAPAMTQVRPFLGNEPPRGWAFCHGQMMPMHRQAMFALLGTAFGGDGRVMYGLPDLRGRTPVGIKPGEITLGQRIEVDGIPALGMNLVVNSDGRKPVRAGYGGLDDDDNIAGDLLISASVFSRVTEDGAMPADGRQLKIAGHRALFDVIGARYGGDGVRSFALPDLQGRMLSGATPRVLP